MDGPLTNDTVTYGYDELGRAVSRTLSGVTTTWTYDALGRLTALGDPIGTFTYGYVANTGRVSSVTYPNGQTTSYAYHPVAQDLRLQEIHHRRPSGATLNKFNYSYDVAGNILTWAQQMDANPAQTYTFEYDRADQLTAATLAAAVAKRYRYAYDPAGNRVVEQIDDQATLFSHDHMNRLITQVPGGSLLFRGTVSEPSSVTIAAQPATVTEGGQFTGAAPVSAGAITVQVKATDSSGNLRTNVYEVTVSGPSVSFTYDQNGNLASDGSKNYEWDAENRLVAVKQGTTTLAAFTYDGQGRRATKVVGTATISFVYDGVSFLEERSSLGPVTRYVYDAGIDRPLAQLAGGAVSYYVADHLGSITRVSDTTGNPTLTREYDPWGNLLQGAATGGYAFTGREWNPEAVLYYYRARYYAPALARFISADPMGVAAGANLYTYVRNSPLINVDPSGLVDLNLLKNEPLHTAAEKCISPPGWYYVAAHGNSRILLDEYSGQRLGPKQVATRIKASKAWKQKTSKGTACRVLIVGCSAGTGSESLAQLVADELGVEVTAVKDGKVGWSPRLQGYCGFFPDLSTHAYWEQFPARRN